MPKVKIPKVLRSNVWNYYEGRQNKIGNCLCCNNELDYDNFHCGHVIAESNGGNATIDNLRPVCQRCNLGMGTKNMILFMQDNHLEPPHNFNGYGQRNNNLIPFTYTSKCSLKNTGLTDDNIVDIFKNHKLLKDSNDVNIKQNFNKLLFIKICELFLQDRRAHWARVLCDICHIEYYDDLCNNDDPIYVTRYCDSCCKLIKYNFSKNLLFDCECKNDHILNVPIDYEFAKLLFMFCFGYTNINKCTFICPACEYDCEYIEQRIIEYPYMCPCCNIKLIEN